MKRIPETRSNDKLLCVTGLKQFYGVDSLSDYINSDCPSIDSITRTRRKIQACGDFLAVDETTHNRKAHEDLFIQYALF